MINSNKKQTSYLTQSFYFRLSTKSENKPKLSSMGRLNKKITAKIGKPLTKSGLSRSHLAARQATTGGGLSHNAVLAKKDALSTLTSADISIVASPRAAARPLPLVEKDLEAGGEQGLVLTNKSLPTKKALRVKLGQTGGGVGKKDRRRIRSDLLHKRLAAAETMKKAAKAKKMREKAVIVKDLHPLIENLQEIEEDIKKVR
jgi:hypothetical protein